MPLCLKYNRANLLGVISNQLLHMLTSLNKIDMGFSIFCNLWPNPRGCARSKSIIFENGTIQLASA